MTFYAYIILACLLLAALVCRAVTILGATRMLRGTSYKMGVTGSILAMIPCSPLWIASLPLGVWSLAVLTRRDVKAGFAGKKAGSDEQLENSAEEQSAQESAVRGPAIGLLITGVLNWIGVVSIFIAMALAGPEGLIIHGETIPEGDLTNLAVVLAVVSSMILVGAFHLLKLKNYGNGILAAILSGLLPPGNVIGLPIGIWALVVLSQKEVHEAFVGGKRREQDDDQTGAAPDAGQRTVEAPADALIVVAGAELLTGIGIVLWLATAAFGWDPTASSGSAQHRLQSGLLMISITYVILGAFMAMSGLLMRRLRARLFVLLCVVLVGVLLPATLALNVVMELEHIPEWPVGIPMWLGIPFAIWAAVVLFRGDVRKAFEEQARIRTESKSERVDE